MKKNIIVAFFVFIVWASIAACTPLLMQVTLEIVVTGQGTVNPAVGTHTYNQGESVPVLATPAAGWKFHGWSGAVTGTQNPATIMMNGNKIVMATFVQDTTGEFTVSITTQGQGQVTKTPNQVTYTANSQVELQAQPAAGWVFKQWQGDLTGGANPTTILMNKNYNITAVFEEQATAQYKWNFLVYLDADNDLESFGILDVNEMERIGSTDDVNILVLIDRSPQYDESNGNWTGTRLYRILKDNANTSLIISELVEDYGELDMSNPQTLSDFIIYCQTNYPAERTLLTLWDHGAGVAPKSMLPAAKGKNTRNTMDTGGVFTPQGICWDDTTGSEFWDCLTTDEVAAAFATARAATGHKLDIVNMDACLMQMIEIAYEWKQEMGYLVGSEETVPGDGNDYTSVLTALTTNPLMTTDAAAKMLVDQFYNYYNANGSGKETYSALAFGSGFDNLIAAFKTFATALKNTNDLEGVYNAWNNTRFFTSNEYNDLYHFASQILAHSSDQTVKNAATALQNSFNQAVILHKETLQYQNYAFGLSVFLATAQEWANYAAQNQYTSLKLSQDSDWDDFILNFVNYTGGGGGTQIAPEVLSFSITWESGDCDLGLFEPDGSLYGVGDRTSPNGIFSGDEVNGGTEAWSILQTHESGYYQPGFCSYDYTGYVTFTLTNYGETASETVWVEPDDILFTDPIVIYAAGAATTLQLHINKVE